MKNKAPLALKRFSRASGEIKKILTMWDGIIFLCTAAASCVPGRVHVTADPSRQAAGSNRIDNNTQEHARTITHSFMQALMYLSMHEREHGLHTLSHRHTILSVHVKTKIMCMYQGKQHIERLYTDMQPHKPAHSLCLAQSSSFTN